MLSEVLLSCAGFESALVSIVFVRVAVDIHAHITAVSYSDVDKYGNGLTNVPIRIC